MVFIGTYLLCTFLLIPTIAPAFGRMKIHNSELVQAKHPFYIWANRNYVSLKLHETLQKIAVQLEEENPEIQLIYMDANFPFIDNFPLLPHLYHSDGKKIDIALIYEELDGKITNDKPTLSGYGYFENPEEDEWNQIMLCKAQGEWHYDFTKYFTFGRVNKEIRFSEAGSANLARTILDRRSVDRIFIEPHLQERLQLNSNKIWYHGCQTVRHDDHIHLELAD